MSTNKDRESKLFDLSYTTSKISNLIDRVRGYRDRKEYEEAEADMEDSSRWENLRKRLSDSSNFQPAEDSEIKDVEEELGKQLDQDNENQ